MKVDHNVELLAPAGSYEAFEAALGAGADAVYVGGPEFGARAYAHNFTQDELLQAIDTVHIHGKKLYLTVNTLLKNRELQDRLYDALRPLYENGLDAVIIQDLGVFQFIHQNFPGLHLHASTQMTVTGPEGMKFLEEQGASRVVAARELSLQELSAMHQASPIEIEAFIHGALCYSFSGQCLMSSIRQKRQSWKMCTALSPSLSGSAGEWQLFIQTTGFLSTQSERHVQCGHSPRHSGGRRYLFKN